ncbi:MAG: hypothetical protein JXQ72_07620 [Anaerolineae bacterium]|nr:hypothetical protein [Anaerolineae bacterium]
MAPALTAEQIKQIINNTMLVMLVQPDLKPEWHENLHGLIRQAQESALEDEAIFAAAVLSLLYAPKDRLPTGTIYDQAWQSLLYTLQTGVQQDRDDQPDGSMTLDQLLSSVTEAVIMVKRNAPDQRDQLLGELAEIHRASTESGVPELVRWLEDVIALVNDAPITSLGQNHTGPFRAYWDTIHLNLSD